MKRMAIVIIVVLAMGAVGAAFLPRDNPATEVPYVTTPIKKGNIKQIVTSTGTLQAVVTVQVGSQISGTIEKLSANFNSEVKKGDIIARLNDNKFKAAVEQAKANLIAAESNFVKAKVGVADALRTLERNRELRKRDLVAQSDLDAAQVAYDGAVAQLGVNGAQIAQAKAAVNQVQVDLDNTVIRSPVDGIVISRNVDVGQTVAASLSAPTLFTIANDLAKMEVHTNVDEADMGNIWEGQEVSFTVDAFPGRRFKGKVHQVRKAPNVVDRVVTYNAVVRINNKDLLLNPGMTANVQFSVKEKKDVLMIPNMALRFKPPEEKDEAQQMLREERRRTVSRPASRRSSGSRGAVAAGQEVKIYVLRDAKALAVDVQLGISDGSRTEVTGGDLNENDAAIIAMSSAATSKTEESGVTNPFRAQRVRGLGAFQ